MTAINDRAEILENAPLRYAPENELGVVYLFANLARKWQLKVEIIRPGFPDCIAYQRIGGREKKIRIEFEYRSSNFKAHGHSARCCDWIVCWEHDWPAVPKHIKVIELKREFGQGFKVWIQPVRDYQQHNLKYKRLNWGLSKRATHGDLLLMYRCAPEQSICDIYRVASPMNVGKAGWRKGNCYHAEIQLVCRLPSPIFLEDLRTHRIIKTSYFVRCNMQGNLHATEYWPYLFDMIVRRNPSLKRKLQRYSPENI
jgi:hypothetical protein